MAKYKCLIVAQFETWLSVEKVYDGEMVVSPREFSGGVWLYIKRADDGFPAFVRSNQFVEENQKPHNLGV